MVSGFRFRVSGSGAGILGFGFRVPGFGFRVSGSGFLVPGPGFRVSGSDMKEEEDLFGGGLDFEPSVHRLIHASAAKSWGRGSWLRSGARRESWRMLSVLFAS